ncbi:calcium/sodium antiporter [Pararhodobacter oceanensis]|uniref:Sodium:proton exchanger n=1 Tax=Pararhodobacter oceanensis TaxID=2172121 RepID=A0A2T8HYF9_9RHOB|nr:calcium/sodium antiporter [Pararhodobacter oceanensis]PVH30480.1 sodium:proton exchanger [Pararhodobacter oceanensis]
MLLDFAMIIAGLVLLVFAGDALVKGAVNLSLRLGIPALIVGLTVVAFGTSAPELLVSIEAILGNAPALALGNVVGSNTANILLVLGIPALITAVPVARSLARDFWMMMAATALFIGLAFLGPLTWMHGLALLAGLALMLWNSYSRARAHRNEICNGNGTTSDPLCDDEGLELEGVEPDISGWKIALFLLAGIIGLPVGARLLVNGSVDIATYWGVSDAVIGLTLVAVGTSLPELATTVAAALRREAGVAMGNVIGSNLFNLLGIIGVATLIGPIPVPLEMLQLDLWVMAAASALLGFFVYTGRSITWRAGLGLLLLYALYVIQLFY